MKWKIDNTQRSEYDEGFSAKGPAGAKPSIMGNAFRVIVGKSINGSGDECFGGARFWPTVRIEVPFFEDDREGAVKFADDFKVFLEDWLKSNGRYDEEFDK